MRYIAITVAGILRGSDDLGQTDASFHREEESRFGGERCLEEEAQSWQMGVHPSRSLSGVGQLLRHGFACLVKHRSGVAQDGLLLSILMWEGAQLLASGGRGGGQKKLIVTTSAPEKVVELRRTVVQM